MLRRAPLVVLLCAFLPACQPAPSLPPVVLTEARQLDAAVLELIQAKVALIQAAPGDAALRASLGLAYEANGIWDLGAECFAQAAQLNPEQALYDYHRALCLREAGDAAGSMQVLRNAAQRLPDVAGVQQRWGQWLLEQGELAEAQAAFERALKKVPDHSDLLAGLASIEVQRERWNEAQALAKRAVKADPGNRSARYAYGMALRGLGNEEEARKQLAVGQGARPRWIEEPLTREFLSYRLTTSGLLEDANAAAAGGNHARAAELYKQLVARTPSDPALKNNLAASLTELGRFEESERVLQEALALDPKLFAVHLNLCDLYTRMNQLDRARPHGEQAVSLGADVGRTHLVFARVLAMQGDYQRAYVELQKAVSLDARDPQSYLALAETAVRLKLPQNAVEWCKKALDLDPGMVPARVNLAVLSLQSNDVEEAKRQLLELEKQAPQHPRVQMIREELKRRGVL